MILYNGKVATDLLTRDIDKAVYYSFSFGFWDVKFKKKNDFLGFPKVKTNFYY